MRTFETGLPDERSPQQREAELYERLPDGSGVTSREGCSFFLGSILFGVFLGPIAYMLICVVLHGKQWFLNQGNQMSITFVGVLLGPLVNGALILAVFAFRPAWARRILRAEAIALVTLIALGVLSILTQIA